MNKEVRKFLSVEMLDIYKNFNVSNQVEKILRLSKEDMLIILAVCINNHSPNDITVISNTSNFKSDIEELLIFVQNKSRTTESVNLAIEGKFDVPAPYTIQEVRDIKLSNLI